MVVSIRSLSATLDALLAGISATDGDSISIPEDFYWHVPTDRLYDVEGVIHSTDSGEGDFLDLGSLRDDVSRLQALADGEAATFRYALRWASGVLRYLGEAPCLITPPSPQPNRSLYGLASASNDSVEDQPPVKQTGSQCEERNGRFDGPVLPADRTDEFECGRRTGALEARRSTLLELAALFAPERLSEFHDCRSPAALESAVKAALMEALRATSSNQ